MKSVSFTIYEFVGYAIPGAVSILAAAIFYWSAVGNGPVNLDVINTAGWWVLGLFGYLAGHGIQAAANGILKWRKNTVDLVMDRTSNNGLGVPLIAAGERVAETLLGAPPGTLSPSSVFAVCDVYLDQKGRSSTREIYVYREGFYRGLALSSALLSLALVVRGLFANSTVLFNKQSISFSHSQCFVLAGICCLLAWASWQRFRRFGKYLVANSLLAAVILQQSGESKSGANAE
jgi:hypothetical protein